LDREFSIESLGKIIGQEAAAFQNLKDFWTEEFLNSNKFRRPLTLK